MKRALLAASQVARGLRMAWTAGVVYPLQALTGGAPEAFLQVHAAALAIETAFAEFGRACERASKEVL